MKKGKLVRRIVIAVAALILAGILFFALFGDGIIKKQVESTAGKTLDVPVTMDDLSLGIFAGSLDIDSLEVGNPEGFDSDNLLTMGDANITLETSSLFSETVKIRNMDFGNITLTIEQKGLTNNLKTVLNNLPQSEKTPEEAPEGKPGKNLLIEQLRLAGVKVRAKLSAVPGQADEVEFKLAPIEMQNLGSEDKMSVAKLAALILTAIAEGLAEQGGDMLPGDVRDSLQGIDFEQGQKLLEDTLKLGDDTLKNGTDAGTEVFDKGKEIGDGLKNLFESKDSN